MNFSFRKLGIKLSALLLGTLMIVTSCSAGINNADFSFNNISTLSSNQNLIVKEIDIKNGKGNINITGIKNPQLLIFGKGTPDKEFKTNYSISKQNSGEINDSFSVKSTNKVSNNDRRERIIPKPKTINKRFIKSLSSIPLKIPKEYNLGDNENFWLELDEPNPNRFSSHRFELKSKTPHLYIWVDKADLNIIDMNMIPLIADFWEKKAYPGNLSTFGELPKGKYDIDNDQHVYMLITSTTGYSRAYFNTIDMLPLDEEEKKYSNYRNLLVVGHTYLNPKKPDKNQLLATVIHEFQHMVNFSIKGYLPSRIGQEPLWEESWLDEGLSVYSEQIGGLALPAHEEGTIKELAYFLEKEPYIPIVTEGDSGYIDYAASYLFVTYIADRFGKNVIKNIVAVPKTGIEAIETVIQQPFSSIFRDWAISLYASGLTQDSKYSYKNFNLRGKYGNHQFKGIKPKVIINKYPTQRQLTSKNWTLYYASLNNINPKDIFNIQVNSSNGSNPVAVIIGTK